MTHRTAGEFASLWDHLEELRKTLLRCFLIIIIGVAISFCFYQEVFHLLTSPLKQSLGHSEFLQHQEIRRERIYNPGPEAKSYTLPSNELSHFSFSPGKTALSQRSILLPPDGYIDVEHIVPKDRLLVLSPLEGMLVSFKTSFWIGLVGTSPFWIFVFLKFLSPALRENERRLLYPFLACSAIFVFSGLAFAFFVTIPLANQYLQAFNMEIGINLWSLSNYIHYSLFLLLSSAAVFELGFLLLFMVHCGFLSAEWMSAKRRHMIVIAFILGAIFTPPDVLTQLMLALPLIGLYELAILYAKIREARREQNHSVTEREQGV